MIYYILNVRSRGKQLVLFSRESTPGLEGKQNKLANWFPEGPDIKCFVIFLDFHFNTNKRITGANQNSRFSTYKNTNIILKTTEWMIYKSTFRIVSASFSSTSCCFSSGKTLKIVAFICSLRLHDSVVDSCCVHPREWKLAVFSPPSVRPLSTTLWSRAVMYPERGTIAQMYHKRYTFDFSQGHVTKNQPMEVPV